MRAIGTACAALAALCLTSCDSNTGAPRTANTGCNCAPPAQAASAPALPAREATPRPRRYRFGHARYVHTGYAWRREYSEASVETYDYHSDSRSFAMAGDGDRTAEHGWIDGYGRGHGGAAGEGAAGAPDGRARLEPWHGYDAECPDKDPK